MSGYMDAGRLDQLVRVLECRETEPGTWAWEPVRKAWAQVTPGVKSNLFSSVGIGARGAELVLRRQPLTLHQALLWGDQHLFLTAILPMGRGHLQASAALVEPVTCRAERWQAGMGEGNRPSRTPLEPVTFPGVLTDKYQGYSRTDTHAQVQSGLVLVTPKAVRLREGDLVTVTGGPAAAVYNVQAGHLLDQYKNEYEMDWSRDV